MIECPSCGKENPEGFSFCGFCTASLAAVPATQREERKIVSVLFCDLVGFTARSEHADPEEVRATLRPYHERAKAEIEAYGGTVEKFVGDAVMAVFGAPISHEDDAERSVRAGLAILDVIDAMNAEEPDLELAVRIAINTGETLVTVDAHPERGEAMVAGDVVNTASRLQGAAPVGSLVVGETTHRTTEPIFEWEGLDPVELKGKAERTPLWRVVQARGRFGVDIMRAPTTPFVGREVDLALLKQIYDRTLRERSVQLVTLVGEPGVGKSRIISELFGYVDELSELVTWRQGRCLPYGDGISFWALGEIVKAQAGILESDTQERAKDKLTVALSTLVDEGGDDDGRPWMTQRLAPLLGWDSASSVGQEESFTAWMKFLESIADGGPAVFVIEDVHWADAPMVAFLEHVVEWSEGFPMLIVCSARPEFYERHPGWGGGQRNTTTIGLSPLSDEETARLVQGLLQRVVLPAKVQAAILERAGGNPLYAEEFVRMLTDRGLLIEDGPTLRLVDDAEIPFPDNVQALIAARLDTLTPDKKALLQDAAVLGKVFWSGAVQTMDARDTADTHSALHELSKKELIRPARRSSLADQTEYAFWHALVRDVAYSQIPRAARGAKHVAAAEWIEAAAQERLGDVAEILVYHYESAGIDDGSGPDSDDLRKSLMRFLLLAADRARWIDVGRAVDLFRRSLELADGDAERAPILLGLGLGISRMTPGGDEGLAILGESVEAFRDAGDRLGEGWAVSCLAELHGVQDGITPQVIEGSRHALELVEPLGVSIELLEMYESKAEQEYVIGHYEESIRWADKAQAGLASIEHDDADRLERLRCRATLQRGVNRLLMGEQEGRDETSEALTRLRGLGTLNTHALASVAEALWPSGLPESVPLFEEAIRLGDHTGSVAGMNGVIAMIPGPLFDLGQWQRAAELAIDGLTRARRSSATDLMFAGSNLMVLSAWMGGENLVDEVEISDHLEGVSEPQILALGLAALSLSAHVLGRATDAARQIQILRSVPGIETEWYYVWRLPMLTRICVEAGDLDLAASLPDGVRPLPIGHEHSLAACEAIMAEARGDLEGAITLYADVIDRWLAFPSVPEQGFALLGRGRCLLQLGRPESVTVLREAREIFVGLGARPLIEETDVQLAQAIALSS